MIDYTPPLCQQERRAYTNLPASVEKKILRFHQCPAEEEIIPAGSGEDFSYAGIPYWTGTARGFPVSQTVRSVLLPESFWKSHRLLHWWCSSWYLFQEILPWLSLHGLVQDAIDETPGRVPAVNLGHFDGFIQDDLALGCLIAQVFEFRQCQKEDILIHHVQL